MAATPRLRARGARLTAIALPAAELRRLLQLGLAGLWLFDGILQLQPYMFTTGFARQVLAPAASGNPSAVAAPMSAIARLVSHHPVPANAGFAAFQVGLGLAIAWRPTVRAALAASIVWALAVWWLGEGLGGVLTGSAGPLAGGPGAALLYAVLAVLVWPLGPAEERSRAGDRAFIGAGRIGVPAARLTWLGLWAALAGLALTRSSRSAQGVHDLLVGMAGGAPSWLAAIDDRAAALAAHRGLAIAVALAFTCTGIAISAFGSRAAVRAGVVAAATLGAVIWVVAQAFGGIAGGQSTDPGSGPLLMLIAIAYWPLAGGGQW